MTMRLHSKSHAPGTAPRVEFRGPVAPLIVDEPTISDEPTIVMSPRPPRADGGSDDSERGPTDKPANHRKGDSEPPA
jgi:hypothetical protein